MYMWIIFKLLCVFFIALLFFFVHVCAWRIIRLTFIQYEYSVFFLLFVSCVSVTKLYLMRSNTCINTIHTACNFSLLAFVVNTHMEYGVIVGSFSVWTHTKHSRSVHKKHWYVHKILWFIWQLRYFTMCARDSKCALRNAMPCHATASILLLVAARIQMQKKRERRKKLSWCAVFMYVHT